MGPWHRDPVVRAGLRAAFWGLPDPVQPRLAEEHTLRALGQSGAAVLWFSEEPWDQLTQLWVLARLSTEWPGAHLELAPLAQGGNQVPPETLRAAFKQRQRLPARERETVVWLWEHFEAEDWPGLREWLDSGQDLPALPHLGPALARALEDRPSDGSGRTERQVQNLMASGIKDLEAMMEALAALETPYGIAWYGDLYVSRLMGRS